MTTKQETSVSKLAASLFDSWATGAPSITDSEIAASVGIELKGGLRDLPYLALVRDARTETKAAMSRFKGLMEEELAKAAKHREDMLLSTAKSVARQTVQNALGQINAEPMRMPYYTGVDAEATEMGGRILILVGARVLTGHTVYNPSAKSRVPFAGSRDDARYIAGRLQDIRVLGFDSVKGLELRRSGRPTIEKVESPVRVSPTMMAYPDSRISVTYAAEFPADMLPVIYAKHSTPK